MKRYFILIILLLSQLKSQTPKIVDTSSQRKMTHRIYTFDGIVRKPWTFYKVINDKLKALPNSEQVINKTKRWNKFILTVRDITIDCAGDSANVIIIYNNEKFRYVLKRTLPNKYTLNNGIDKFMLITKSSLICDFYFIKVNEAASVSNMDWEMAN